MARGGRAELKIDLREFDKSLEVLLHHVERGTKRATKAAAKEIFENSQKQVPKQSATLARSGYYEIRGYRRDFEAVIGYGGNGNPINPATGERASEYMVAVHEDLEAKHPNGKAKYLEDPVREYQQKFLTRAASIIRKEMR